MTIDPQLVNISPEIICYPPKYVNLRDCRESHLRTFCRQIHQCTKIGGGGFGQINVVVVVGEGSHNLFSHPLRGSDQGRGDRAAVGNQPQTYFSSNFFSSERYC